jgi:hypothetical protein
MKIAVISLALFLAFFSIQAFSCQFDTDCSVGSKCLKKSGELYGMCAAGMQPGNDYDKKPYRDQLDVTKKVGNTCSFDVDCGPGNRCMKQSGQIKGACMK